MYTPVMLLAKQEAAYEALSSALVRQLNADQRLKHAQADLEDAKTAVISNTDPKDLGSNAEARAAKVASCVSAQAAEVFSAEDELRVLRNEVEIARLTVERWKEASKLLYILAVTQDVKAV